MSEPPVPGAMPAAPRHRRPSVLARMTVILDAFDDASQVLVLDELGARTGLPRSTIHRILGALVALDWLVRDGRGYRLGVRALGALGPEVRHTRIRTAAADILQDLYLQTGLAIHLGVLDGAHEYFLDKLGGAFTLALASRVGSRLPAHRGGGGRAMLALLSPERVDNLVRPRLAGPDAGGWTLATLHAELGRIRRAGGIAFDDRTFAPGTGRPRVGSVSAAVLTADGTAISLSAAARAGTVRLDRVAPVVRAAADQLARVV